MRRQYLKWILNGVLLIALFVLWGIDANPKKPWIWQPYLMFAIGNWLFADVIFQYIPARLLIKRYPVRIQWWVDAVIASVLAGVVFYFSSRYLLDDAGYVLRYVQNFKQGYFYHFNPGDPPVFGLSGFIYGVVCFIISLTGLPPAACLKLANLLGSIAYVFVLLQICRHLVKDKRMVWLVFILLAWGLDAVVLMFASGLELPVHISIVLATILFFLQNKHKLFLVFAALSIISKLDAVPLMAVLMALYTWEQVVLTHNPRNLVPILLYTAMPLSIWVVFTLFLFGSPLPQSAFAKYYYHPNPDKHAFPFLFYFMEHPVRKIAGWLFEFFALLHFLEMLYYRKIKQVKTFVFGFMFIAIMALFYYYNPNERMIWYNSIPYFLLMAQVLFSFVYWTSKNPIHSIPAIAVVPILAAMLPVMRNVNQAVQYHNFYTERVERERYLVGNYMHDRSTPGDTLMSSHGLVGWKFKGYVMDLSGLNSKLVTSYHRNVDSLIHDFKPHYIINHAWTADLNTYGKHGFGIDTIFADVTLLDYPYWAVMKRVPSKKRGYAKLPLDVCHNMYDVLDKAQVVRFYSDSLYIWIKDIPGTIPKLWTGIKREENSFTLDVTLLSDSTIMQKHTLWIEKGDPGYVSKYVKGVSIPLECKGVRATAITIVPRGIYSFTCLGPILEFIYE